MSRKSRVRPDKIKELKAFFDQYPNRPLATLLFRLHSAMHKGEMIGPYSQAEIGLSIFSDEKVIERILKAIGDGYNRLRKWKICRSVAPFPERDEQGFVVMVNKDRDSYEETSIKYGQNADGCHNNDRKFRRITSLSKKELEEQLLADEIAIEKEELEPLKGPEITVPEKRKRKLKQK